MSENNICQILVRNLSSLKSKRPLFINLTADSFIQDYLLTYPDSQITTFNSNFQAYQQHKKNSAYPSYFDATYQGELNHDLVIIQYPKAKAELSFILAMLESSLDSSAIVVIVGEKNSGINSSKKIVERYLSHYQKNDSARHCMLFSGRYQQSGKNFVLNDWFNEYPLNIAGTCIKVAALPGVFSQKKLDIGTRVLLENLPNIKPTKLLDFGCGAGVIASFIAKQHADISLTLADVSALAISSAKRTLAMNQLTGDVIATDSLSHIKGHFDVVITNPPFHQGLKTNYHATESFLTGINKHIENNGELIVVANNFLTYKPIMQKNFAKVNELINQQGFIVYHCLKKN